MIDCCGQYRELIRACFSQVEKAELAAGDDESAQVEDLGLLALTLHASVQFHAGESLSSAAKMF